MVLKTLTILYDDEQLIAIPKPAGQAVIPGRGFDAAETLVRQVEQHLGAKAYVVHRIDRETSGIVVFAKNADVHRALCLQFEHREVHKIYLALVQGVVACDGVIDKPLRQFGSGRMGVAAGGQAAVTHYRRLEQFPNSTLLEIRPETGRRHQIRVHLYALGHSILGDPLYGHNRPVGGAPRLMLHAYVLTFQHPAGHTLTLQADPGEDWQNVLQQYKR
jgi:tRNA pseudouridine32 synthase / 23S rRNA pseudouridine746 synthase